MWIPKSADEIERVVTARELHETSTLDAKRELGKSKDIARDVAAMANDGGVLLYGVAEDEHKRPTILAPFTLAGEAERIDQIVRMGLAEPPIIVITPLPRSHDPAVGYLVVAVPPSPRAPHMVLIDKDNRFYGRTATGNTPLTQGDVDRLYERRKHWEVDRDALLAEQIARAPLAPDDDFGYIHLIARPVAADEGLLDRARKDQNEPTLLQNLVTAASQRSVFASPYDPDFRAPNQWQIRADGWLAHFGTDPRYDQNAVKSGRRRLDLQVNNDGTAYLFHGRAAERREDDLYVFPDIVAGITTRFLYLVGQLYDAAHYFGAVDIGLAVTGIQAGTPYFTNRAYYFERFSPYDRNEYRRTIRVIAPALAADAQTVAENLVMPFIRALTQGVYNPFPKKDT